MSPLQNANHQIVESLRDQARRRAVALRERRPVRAIDALLADLEELHLVGRKRVPETLDGRLAVLAAALPPEHRSDLRSRITIVHLMDRLYDIQELLLRARSADAAVDESDHADLSRAS